MDTIREEEEAISVIYQQLPFSNLSDWLCHVRNDRASEHLRRSLKREEDGEGGRQIEQEERKGLSSSSSPGALPPPPRSS